ncbi:uncharacterized protein STEHIDRAFT_163757 [Stereum hirsutum FP-91666 SS1]|uniref:Uncharacterized protein n=1 Tax=Stereum hirsutum (strain FP-91666) TaxID=721885 RepID=R7RX56_STEHR|nr:uncharacterized protein STEHIDRAFT_163757 [Stereum hirsutum FP-91666 SS1]EIM79398.1 hypothetical protein STEHIDRAFT_163757 [Stereum hirsutum FP-91666 SS1]
MPTIACPYVLPLLLPHHSESSLSLPSPVIYAYDGELTASLRAPRSYRSFRWSVLRCYRPHTGRLGPAGFVNDWLVNWIGQVTGARRSIMDVLLSGPWRTKPDHPTPPHPASPQPQSKTPPTSPQTTKPSSSPSPSSSSTVPSPPSARDI